MTQQITAQADGFLTTGSIYAFSNGDIAALFLRGGTGYYAVSQDGGTTWGPAQAVPQWSTVAKWRLGATQHGDSVALLTSPSFSASLTGTVSGTPLALSTLPYNTTLHQFGAPTTVSVMLPGVPANTVVQFGDIAWNSGDSSYYLAAAVDVNNGAQQDVRLLRCTSSGTVSQVLPTGWTYSTLYGVSLLVSGTAAYVLAGDSSRANAVLLPFSISGAMTMGAAETVSAVAFDDAPQTLMRSDGSGHVDFVTQGQHTGLVRTFRRTATNTYGSTTTLDTVDAAARVPAAVFDPASSDLTVYYSHVASGAAQTYAKRRLAGTWQTAVQVDTRSQVTANPVASSGHGLLVMAASFATGFSAGGVPLDYIGSPGAAVPDAPSNMTPNGYTNTVTPSLTSTYTNIAPGDIQHSLQDVVTRDSDSVVMWDSGEVVTTASSQTYAGTALSFNTNYTWKRRYKDEITRAFGPYASVPLQPAHLPTATITSVAFAGTTASATPFTLTDPTLGVTATFTQADGDSADQYQLVVLKADGVTAQELGPVVPLSPVVTNSASFTTATHNFASLVNSTTYTLGVMTRDAATGRVSLGPLWTFTTAWPPPSSPTGLTVAPNDQAGTIAVTWTNSGGALTTTLLEVSLDAGTTWVTHYSGPPISSRTLRGIAPGQPFLVRVSLANSVGSSAPTVSTSYTLGLNAYINGIILTDTVTLQSVFLGPTESEESLGLKNITSFQEIERMGQKNFRYFFSRLETRAGSWDVTLRASERQQDGTYVYSADKERIMRALENNHNDVLLRTVLGEVHTVKVLNVDPKPFKGRVLRCTFDLKKVDDAPFPLTS